MTPWQDSDIMQCFYQAIHDRDKAELVALCGIVARQSEEDPDRGQKTAMRLWTFLLAKLGPFHPLILRAMAESKGAASGREGGTQ